MNSCDNNSEAVARCLGFFTRHIDMNSLNARDHLEESLRVGGSRRGIWMRARMGCMSNNGGSHSANSMATIPSDQTSDYSQSYARLVVRCHSNTDTAYSIMSPVEPIRFAQESLTTISSIHARISTPVDALAVKRSEKSIPFFPLTLLLFFVQFTP